MTGEKVIAEAETQCQLLSGLPIILKIGAELQVTPVPKIAFELRRRGLIKAGARRAANPRIYTTILFRWGIGGKIQGVEELIRWAIYAEFAVLNVPPEIRPDLQVVVAVADRDHVRIGVDMLFEELRVTRIRAEACCSVIELSLDAPSLGHAGECRRDQSSVLLVPDPSLVQDSR